MNCIDTVQHAEKIPPDQVENSGGNLIYIWRIACLLGKSKDFWRPLFTSKPEDRLELIIISDGLRAVACFFTHELIHSDIRCDHQSERRVKSCFCSGLVFSSVTRDRNRRTAGCRQTRDLLRCVCTCVFLHYAEKNTCFHKNCDIT